MTGCLLSRARQTLLLPRPAKLATRRVRHLPSFARLGRRGRLPLREAWLRGNACNAAFGGLHALGQGGEEHPCVRRDDKQDE
jgi:hypothetical protein